MAIFLISTSESDVIDVVEAVDAVAARQAHAGRVMVRRLIRYPDAERVAYATDYARTVRTGRTLTSIDQ